MAYCWNVVCYSKKESQEILKCIVSLSLVGKKNDLKKKNHTNIERTQSFFQSSADCQAVGKGMKLELHLLWRH